MFHSRRLANHPRRHHSSGRIEISAILAQLIASRIEIEVEQLVFWPAGDMALASGQMTLSTNGPEGARTEQVCEPTIAFRMVEDRWKIAILAFWASRISILA